MERYYIDELEGDALREAIEETAEFNGIEVEDWFAEMDGIMAIASDMNYVFNENGEKLDYHNGKYMTSYEYAMSKV